MKPTKIISGGQTGPDRAALDFAIAHGITHGGWCPRGRLAEDGPITNRYELVETPSSEPVQRTEWNVRDSDGTVIFSIAPVLTGGSQLTADFAERHGKPWLHISHECDGVSAVAQLADFLAGHEIRALNVAGPRSSEEVGIYEFAMELLTRCLV